MLTHIYICCLWATLRKALSTGIGTALVPGTTIHPIIRTSLVADMHQNPQNRPDNVVCSEPLHCYSTFFFSFSPDDSHQRSRSLNDIDCGLRLQGVHDYRKHERSPSSDEALEAAAQTMAYPLVPCRPPLFQSPTPDGLPEFGSNEAQELRLMPPSRFQRLTEALQRILQADHNSGGNTEAERDCSTGTPQHEASHRAQDLETPASILRRMMGTVSPVSVPRPPHRPRRSSLPKGVIRASQPGVLTQAEDGSQIRGRFGNRASGHGVGQRTISIHPLARLRDSSGLQDAIEEIEKACAREDERQRGSDCVTRQEGRRPRGSSAAEQVQNQDDATPTGGPVVAYTPANERLTVQRLQQRRFEHAEIRTQPTLLQAPSRSLNAVVSGYYAASSSSTEQQAARFCQLTIEGAIESGGFQVTNDQTGSGLSPHATSGIVNPLDMVEPGPYSSYSSFSFSSAEVSGLEPARFQNGVPTTDSSLEQQEPGNIDSVPQQQLPGSRRLPVSIC